MDPKSFVVEYSIKSLVCCFSGGKDSLVATHCMLSQVERVEDLDRYVVFVDTGASLPGVIDYVREVADLYDWPLRILSPEEPFFQQVKYKGAPSIRRRWCCYSLKLKPIIDFVKSLRPQRAEVVGLRREESKARSKLSQIIFKKRTWSWGYAPIIDWTKSQVAAYICQYKLKISPLYQVLKHSGECLCGAYASLKQLRIIRDRYPEWFYQFVEAERDFKNDGSFFWLHGKRIYARDLWQQRNRQL